MLHNIDYSKFITEAGHWAQVCVFAYFIYVVGRYWMNSYKISIGHDVGGRLCILILLISLCLMAWGPDRITLVRIMIYGSLSLYGTYINWYNNRYPVPDEFLTANGPARKPSMPVYVPREALLRYLIRTDSQMQKRLNLNLARNAMAAFGLLFLVCWGFSRTVNAFGWGQQQVVAERKNANKLTRAAVDSAVAAMRAQIRSEVAPIIEGQDSIKKMASAAVVVARKTENSVNTQLTGLKQQAKSAAAASKAAASESKRTRESQYYAPYLTPIPATAPTGLSPTRVQPFPAPSTRPRRGGKSAYFSIDSIAVFDSLILARFMNPNPPNP